MKGISEWSDSTSTGPSTSGTRDRFPSSDDGYWGEPSQLGAPNSEGDWHDSSLSMLGTKFSFNDSEYQIFRELGAGGFATTYLAKPTAPSAEQLVVKVPKESVLLDPTWQEKFRRESTIAANRSHPNLVAFKGRVQLDGDKPAILLEYVEDSTVLGQLAPKVPGIVGSILAQALYGLRALHLEIDGSRIIHRDISPNNVLVTEKGLVKIIDFGLAKDEPRKLPLLTRSTESFGTLGCMAPEQESGAADVDERADLYSLGKSIASWLQKRKPNHVEIHELPEPWRPLLAKLAAFHAADRYPSAEAAIRALLAVFNDLGKTFDSLLVHYEEFDQWEIVPDEWIRMANTYVAELDGSNRIELCSRLGAKIFASSHFDIAQAFGLLDESIGQRFDDGNASFQVCDPVGTLLERWYPSLPSLPLKLRCLRRLVTMAVQYNRYLLMGQVRNLFAATADPGEKQRMKQVIKESDPEGIIWIP